MTGLTLDMPHNPKAIPTQTKTYLDVRFNDKAVAKAFGAKWDANVKRWFYPRGSKLEIIFSWRTGKHGVGGKELIGVPEKDNDLAAQVGGLSNGTGLTTDNNYMYFVEPRTTLHLIYSWRKTVTRKAREGHPAMKVKRANIKGLGKPFDDTPPNPVLRKALHHEPLPAHLDVLHPPRTEWNPDTAEPIPAHILKIKMDDRPKARALGIHAPQRRNNQPKVLSGSWYARILSWHTFKDCDRTLPINLELPTEDVGLAEYLGAMKDSAGNWITRPGSILHTALLWRIDYQPNGTTG